MEMGYISSKDIEALEFDENSAKIMLGFLCAASVTLAAYAIYYYFI